MIMKNTYDRLLDGAKTGYLLILLILNLSRSAILLDNGKLLLVVH